MGTGESHVFGGKDNHTAGNEAGVFTGFKKAGKVVKSGIGLGGTHGFNEGAYAVVVLVAGAIIAQSSRSGDFFDCFCA